MQTIVPLKLKKGDGVRIIAPARSLQSSFISQDIKDLAIERLEALGLLVSFGKHVNEKDMFNSSSIQSRIQDLHEAFCDSSIKLVITVIGGFNSNQLLKYIDYSLIKNNPKILCGYSDITALGNAIYAKTGLVTYSGPHYFSFGDKKGFTYTEYYFIKCLFFNEFFEIKPSERWSDDRWATNQENRVFMQNKGYWIINEGKAEGTIIGGNLSTLQLLKGTEYMPSLNNSVLFIEDDDLTGEFMDVEFDRNLQSLIHLPNFSSVRGIAIGRFELGSKMTKEKISEIIKSKKELKDIPVIANVDFGHSYPMITFPIGGTVRIRALSEKPSIKFIKY